MGLFINIWDYEDKRYPFQIFIGGRGIGKTYSALSGAVKREQPFILMRRTDKEMDLLLDSDQKGEGINPFKPINRDMGVNVGLRAIRKNLAGIYRRDADGAPEGLPIGYGLALSTIAGIRGIDLSDVTDWIYDEFIPETHVRKISGEDSALFNGYETINRNRELSGQPPIRLWLLANSNDIYNPIFVGLKIVTICEQMIDKGLAHRYLPDRGLAIHILPPSKEFVEQKSQTALYKLTKGTDFYAMALGNAFAYNDFSLIESRSIKGHTPLCHINDLYVWRHKGTGEIYVTYARGDCPGYEDYKQDLMRFYRDYGFYLKQIFTNAKICFENFELKQRLLTYLVIK